MKQGHYTKPTALFVATLFSCLTIFQFSASFAAPKKSKAKIAKYKGQSVQATLPKAKKLAAKPRAQPMPAKIIGQKPLSSEARVEQEMAAGAPIGASPQTFAAAESQQSVQTVEAIPQLSKSLEQRPTMMFVPNDNEFLSDFGYTYLQGTASGSQRINAALFEATKYDVKSDRNNAFARFAYGLSGGSYLGMSLDYEQTKFLRTSDISVINGMAGTNHELESSSEGIGDPRLFGGYKLKMSSMTAVLGLNGSISPGKNEIVGDTRPKENRFDGGNTLGLSAGLFNHTAQSMMFGFDAGYLIRFDRVQLYRSDLGRETEYNVTGGNSWVLKSFMEFPVASNLGLEYQYLKNEKFKRKNSGSSQGEVSFNDTTEQMVSGYMLIKTHQNFQLIPALRYGWQNGVEEQYATINRSTFLGGSIIGRLIF